MNTAALLKNFISSINQKGLLRWPASECSYRPPSMQDAFRKQSWIRITLVVISLAAAALAVTGRIVRSAAEHKLREAILAELQPVALENCTLKRFGSANDGGYLMCDNLIA